jgi:5-hydroxyisourate hydrolase-like protein (transthyretin family)
MYKFFKEEVNALRKLKKNESKETTFENNGFNFLVNKYPGKISMKSYYFDIIEIIFSISKYEKDNFNVPKNIKSYLYSLTF